MFLYRANQGTLGAGLADSQRELVFQFGPWMVQVNDHDPGE